MAATPPRQPTAARQAEIVSTLLQLAAERSALEITTTDIARAMNVSQGALFRHFPTKEAIRLAVVDWIESSLMQRLDAAREEAATPVEALRGMFRAHVRFFMEYPGAPRFVFGELQHPSETPVKERVCQLMRHYRERLGGVLEQAAGCGLLRPDLDRDAAASLFLGAIQGLVIQAMVTGDPSRLDAQAPALFELYLSGLEVRP